MVVVVTVNAVAASVSVADRLVAVAVVIATAIINLAAVVVVAAVVAVDAVAVAVAVAVAEKANSQIANRDKSVASTSILSDPGLVGHSFYGLLQ